MIRARVTSSLFVVLALVLSAAGMAGASEAELILPNLASERFLGVDGWTLLLLMGAVICAFGLVFGFMQFNTLKNLPVHRSMLEISELIYETCKTYLITQGKFILILEALHRRDHRRLLRLPACTSTPIKVVVILLFSLVGIARQLRRRLVRHPRQHLRQLAHRVRERSRASRSRPTPSRSRPA